MSASSFLPASMTMFVLTSELVVLLLACVLGLVQIFLAIGAATRIRGVAWNRSSRDEPQPALPAKAARLDRALQNFKETFPFFLAAVFIVTASGRSGVISTAGAWLYLIARVAYVPLYANNFTGIRTAVWTLSTLGIVLVLLQALI